MQNSRLQINCVKFCKSEGLYSIVADTNLFVCINGKLVTFRFGEENLKDDKKLEKSGGRIYRPSTLKDFVETVRSIKDSER